MSNYMPSARAQAITRRTYNRPLTDDIYETWEQSIARVINHQRWLWERAQGDTLKPMQLAELAELQQLMVTRSNLPAGRTLWLGGTELVKRREASMFNCSFMEIRTVHDLVDAFWLLLQGCGVGFKPATGVLSGFVRKMEVVTIRSEKKRGDPRGNKLNVETFDPTTKTWVIRIGDSAESWAKAIGKLVAGKYAAKKLVLDYSEIRAAGEILKGYGWACSGDSSISVAFEKIAGIMNNFAGKLLSKAAVWDIANWLGTTLSSRRSAEIGLIDYGDPEWQTIATRKYKGFMDTQDWYRSQSNNSLIFHEKPTKRQLRDLFDLIIENGGSEPGFVNAKAALKRAPWFRGLNPCAEILLANYGFCNLVETDLYKFKDKSPAELHRALYLISRANYRQTCVNLRDGVLQDAWHQTNEYLRLCGVGLTGIVRRPDLTPYDFRQMRNSAIHGAYSQADELELERPKNVTTIKPSGTLSKIMDTTEGCHRPLGKFIFNNVSFSKHSPVLPRLLDAGYRLWDCPNDPGAVLAVFPEAYPDVQFDKVGNHYLNKESAISQLNRYRMLMREYCDQNVSITISYDPSESKEVVDWLDKNWDENTVATSFLFRADPFKTAQDLGYPYLPQSVVTEKEYREYASKLKPLDLTSEGSVDDQIEVECAGGSCPVR